MGRRKSSASGQLVSSPALSVSIHVGHIRIQQLFDLLLAPAIILPVRVPPEISVWDGRVHGSFTHHVPYPPPPNPITIFITLSVTTWFLIYICDIKF